MKVYLLLGTNIEPRLEFLRSALGLIQAQVGAIVQQSKVYETAAWGKENQSDFLNLAIAVETDFEPATLLAKLKAIEGIAGRQQREVWGEREIDIDILLMEDSVFKLPTLEVPHPRLHERNFVLQPLLEIAPTVLHPVLQQSIATLAAACSDLKEVRVFEL